MSTFDTLLGQTRGATEILQMSDDDERRAFEAEHPVELPPLRRGDAIPIVSDRAIDLILSFEVSSAAVYTAKYRHPVWPAGQSGVTIGIGYDIGYVTAAQLAADWTASIGAGAVQTLTPCCGMKGAAAQQALPRVASVDVPFDVASTVFKSTSLQKYTRLTVGALPKAATIPPDCLGALVSLVYNRGASFGAPGDRYTEMRAIAADIASGNLNDVPAQMRSMKRLWANDPKTAGLVTRRELEALLFEHGLT